MNEEDGRYNDMLNRFLAAIQPHSRLIEIGSRARSGNTYRSLFPETIDYVGFDAIDGPNVDVVGDAHALSRHVTGPFDFAFSISVFEHLAMPWKVAIELNHVLADRAFIYIQSHQTWPLHDEPCDYWRFSKDAWGCLFNQDTGFRVLVSGYRGRALITHRDLDPHPAEIGLATQQGWFASGCLAQKIGPALVSWNTSHSGSAYPA